MDTPAKKLFLLDAYALIYRAHFAFTKTPRINSRGVNTSVPFGFTNTLMEVIQKQKPTHIGVAFDTAAKTFRDKIFADYKATRQETPEDIRYGIPKVKEIIRGFNIPILELDGFEADDIIGTIASQACQQGFEVYMMTPDKDFGQLVNDCVFLYKPAYMGNAVDVLGVKEVCEKWDIENVSQVRDILGLQGDTSDNIPGVPGIGPKTAAALIKQYGSVENAVAHAHELKGKQKELMTQYGEQAILSKQLATIITDVPIAFDEEQLRYTGPIVDILKPIFDDLEFKAIAGRAFGDSSTGTTAAPKVQQSPQLNMFAKTPAAQTEEKKATVADTLSYYMVDLPELRKAFLENLCKQESIAIESITDDAANFEYQLKGLAFSWKEGEAHFIPIGTAEEAEQVALEFKTVFEDEKIAKTGHNLKAFMLALKKYGVELRGPLFDIMLAHYLIEPEASHALRELCSAYLNYEMLADPDSKQKNQVCERVDKIFQVRSLIEKDLAERGHQKLMSDVEMPLATVLAAMEYEGVKVDVKALNKMSEDLKGEIERVQKEIYQIAESEFNIGSPKQLGEVLFEKMKLLEKPKKTKSGQYATGEDVLLGLAAEHEIARKILDYREYDKLRSTYVEALPRMISQYDGRIHTDYRQAWAVTGRLSSNNPNLQNIPIRTEKGRQIRKAFVARNEDYLFMSADYSQIELRIAASFAKDETMIEAFRTKRDIHTTTAAKVFKVAIEDVTADMRRKAKEVNFGILYGSTAFGLSQNLGIPRAEASEIIKAYFQEFSAIKRYMDDSIGKAREIEYVETIMGRRRYLRDINSRNMATRGFAERNAINAPIQGSAADIIKIAMVNIHRWLTKEKLKTRMTMQVHDELVFDVHKDEVDVVKENVIQLMRSAVQLEVPMEVEIGVADNWLDAH
ncbi:DNA polymerase I [Fulvivirgaceae bacterium PWU4]|uniref:DNA polymerase I n=1 Tax=Chryseosolibacter histidini TaxID=2782349 RepID=A0AAP2DS07_9BACT|nr:DNA polymerase I [Chryseosolibacter histidini]MBT1701490.1 DNA polymerase I [Chryseosolibacter histidini]